MNTDRELLEFASKAAYGKLGDEVLKRGWNPLADDGDAWDLAIRCNILFIPAHYYSDEPDPAFAARLALIQRGIYIAHSVIDVEIGKEMK
jgi:hypothetical protein